MPLPASTAGYLDRIEASAAELAAEFNDLRSRDRTGLSEADLANLDYRLGQVAAKLSALAAPPAPAVPPV